MYLKGRFYQSQRGAANLALALNFFQQALNADPQFALAHASASTSYALIANYGLQPPATVLQQAKDAAMQAIELDPQLGEAHASYALALAFKDLDWVRAERSFRRAISLNPDNEQAHA